MPSRGSTGHACASGGSWPAVGRYGGEEDSHDCATAAAAVMMVWAHPTPARRAVSSAVNATFSHRFGWLGSSKLYVRIGGDRYLAGKVGMGSRRRCIECKRRGRSYGILGVDGSALGVLRVKRCGEHTG